MNGVFGPQHINKCDFLDYLLTNNYKSLLWTSALVSRIFTLVNFSAPLSLVYIKHGVAQIKGWQFCLEAVAMEMRLL